MALGRAAKWSRLDLPYPNRLLEPCLGAETVRCDALRGAPHWVGLRTDACMGQGNGAHHIWRNAGYKPRRRLPFGPAPQCACYGVVFHLFEHGPMVALPEL